MPDFSRMVEGYSNLWKSMEVTKRATVEKVARGIMANRGKYEAVTHETGVPWEWIACVHHRESSGDFAGVLHNGQRIIGTGKKTTLVPKGRGPFETWEAAAIDALVVPPHSLQRVKTWSVERMLYEFERYNGWGYIGRINSPYVWAATNHQQRGKYVADGKFDPNTMDKQLGCAALLKVLFEMQNAEKPTEAQKPVPAPSTPDKPASPASGILSAILAAIKAILSNFRKGN